jgi:hypothetical protein
MNQREYNDRRSMAELREHVAVLEQQLLGMSEVAKENEQALLGIDKLLRIISETVVEANDVGGVDLNDLADRVCAEGFELPGDDE